MSADIKERLSKIRAIAERGLTESERENSAKMFERLLDAHGITEAELDDKVVETYEFKGKNTRDLKLIVQVAYKVLGEVPTIYEYSNDFRKLWAKIGIDCTAVQSVEIRVLHRFYRDLYEAEEDAMYFAFIQKHRLFGTTDREIESPSDEELEKMRKMMSALDSSTPQKLITGR